MSRPPQRKRKSSLTGYDDWGDFNYRYNCLGEMVHSGPDWDSDWYTLCSDVWAPNNWLEHAIIGEEIDAVSPNAFYGCENLRKITVKGTHTNVWAMKEGTTIIAPAGSWAEEYAKKFNCPFVPLL